MLGTHPQPPHPFAVVLRSEDGTTASRVPFRSLSEMNGQRDAAVRVLREMLTRHHISPENEARDARRIASMQQLGLGAQQAHIQRFPRNPSTRKGNLAEVVLAEYITAARNVILPVYRLRYNPNIDQSMKGDDVLAFDFGANPVTIIVGEAKFRSASSAAAVTEIVEALVRSQKAGLPVSVQFVADRLYEAEETALADRVSDCARLLALGDLKVDYVGLLISDPQAKHRVEAATPNSMSRLAMIALGIDGPSDLVDACYLGLE